MAQNSKKQGNTPPTAKNAPKTRKKPISELKTAAKELSKTKIDTELLNKCFRYYFEQTKDCKNSLHNIVTRIKIGVLQSTLLKVDKYPDIFPFNGVFDSWLNHTPPAAIAAANGLAIGETQKVIAHCVNAVCANGYEYAINAKMQPLPLLKSDAEKRKDAQKIIKLLTAPAKPKKNKPLHFSKAITADFMRLGIAPPKFEFPPHFKNLTHTAKMIVAYEKAQKMLMETPQMKYKMPQSTEIVKLILKIQKEKERFYKIGWFTS